MPELQRAKLHAPAPAPDFPRATPSIRYVELHCKTNFSFLEGASHPDELVKWAAALGYAGLAVTDRNSVAGVAPSLAARVSGIPVCRLRRVLKRPRARSRRASAVARGATRSPFSRDRAPEPATISAGRGMRGELEGEALAARAARARAANERETRQFVIPRILVLLTAPGRAAIVRRRRLG